MQFNRESADPVLAIDGVLGGLYLMAAGAEGEQGGAYSFVFTLLVWCGLRVCLYGWLCAFLGWLNGLF